MKKIIRKIVDELGDLYDCLHGTGKYSRLEQVRKRIYVSQDDQDRRDLIEAHYARAASKARELSIMGVPKKDARRSISLPAGDCEKATKLGFDQICGLKITCE